MIIKGYIRRNKAHKICDESRNFNFNFSIPSQKLAHDDEFVFIRKLNLYLINSQNLDSKQKKYFFFHRRATL